MITGPRWSRMTLSVRYAKATESPSRRHRSRCTRIGSCASNWRAQAHSVSFTHRRRSLRMPPRRSNASSTSLAWNASRTCTVPRWKFAYAMSSPRRQSPRNAPIGSDARRRVSCHSTRNRTSLRPSSWNIMTRKPRTCRSTSSRPHSWA